MFFTYLTTKDKIKETHSKFAILIWILFGIYALFSGRMYGIKTPVIFFSVGLFVASFASILLYLVKLGLAKIFVKAKASDVLVILTGYIFLLVDLVWVVYVATIFLSFVSNF